MPFGDGRDLGLITNPHANLPRCPHCGTAHPTLARQHVFNIVPKRAGGQFPADGRLLLQWHVYVCESCGGTVSAASAVPANLGHTHMANAAQWVIPSVQPLSADIPARPANYLRQARETLHSPAASVVMSASAVDAMLKEREYTSGSLYSRIEKAERDGVLTKHMADWAHDVRLDANDERHADVNAADATGEDATRCLEFAETLADLLFVLPARVKRGRAPLSSP
jgi:hypothetical protein